MLDRWEEIRGTLTAVQSTERGTVVRIDGNEILLDGVDASELEELAGNDVSIIRTESGYRWSLQSDK